MTATNKPGAPDGEIGVADTVSGPLTARSGQPLSGKIKVPGDKSMSHRSLIFGALAKGTTRVSGLLQADDVLRTGACLRALGISIERQAGEFIIEGGTWQTPSRALYCGNAGTGVRLLMGAVAGQGIEASFDGDESLRKRPMGRVLTPLEQMGLETDSSDGKLPVTLRPSSLKAINWRMQNASAQVKSAILLAALGAKGETVIEEPVLSRDHTERMLGAFGVTLTSTPLEGGGRRLSLQGGQHLTATKVIVPADPSSAAFPVVAALVTPGSDVTVTGVLMNPGRIGLFTSLKEMGADLTFENERIEGGEPIADIHARHSALRAIEVPAERAPSMIDEYPILAVAASFAMGKSRFDGLEELRIKESDRLAAVAAGLAANGVAHQTGPDWLEVTGGETVNGGGHVLTHMDHRIAMSFLIMGLASQNPVTIDSGAMIVTSFPGFVELFKGMGAQIKGS